MKTVDNFYLTKVIGGGAYGTVYLCKIRKEDRVEPDTRDRMRPNRRVACKMIKQKNVKTKIRKYLVQEIEIMMTIKHDNILRFLEAKKTSNNIYIFFEFCNGGDLRRFLDIKGGKLDEKLTKVIVKQIGEGLNFLNQNKAMHRDLKLDNILLNFPEYKEEGSVTDEYIRNFDPTQEKIEVIIGDLGFARSLGNSSLAESYCGTPLNMAPEIMNGDLYDTKVDIWSLGTMMYELLVGFTPFTGNDPHDLALRVNEGNYGVPKNIKLSLPCLEVLHKCLQINPKKRISHEDLLKHPFLEDEQDEENKISLSCSQGPGQKSFFDMPSSGFDINQDNAVIFNARDSILFNNVYQNTLKKFQQKHENGEDVKLPEDEEDEPDIDVNELPDVGFVVNDDDDISSFIIKKDEDEEAKGIPMSTDKKVEAMKSSKRSSNKASTKAVSPPIEHPVEEPIVEEPIIEKPLVEELKKEEPVVDPTPSETPKAPFTPIEPENPQPIVVKPNQIEEPNLTKKLEEDKSENSDVDVLNSDSESDDNIGFTIIDPKKYNMPAIPEAPSNMEISVAGSTAKSTNKKAENGQKEESDLDDLDNSFEIVHYHDIQMLDKDYLIESSKAY